VGLLGKVNQSWVVLLESGVRPVVESPALLRFWGSCAVSQAPPQRFSIGSIAPLKRSVEMLRLI